MIILLSRTLKAVLIEMLFAAVPIIFSTKGFGPFEICVPNLYSVIISLITLLILPFSACSNARASKAKNKSLIPFKLGLISRVGPVCMNQQYGLLLPSCNCSSALLLSCSHFFNNVCSCAVSSFGRPLIGVFNSSGFFT